MGLAQEIITSHPNIGEKVTSMGAHGGSVTAVGSAATVMAGLPVNVWITMIVGIGGLIVAIMSYRLNAKYKKMHYELEVERVRGRFDEIEEGPYVKKDREYEEWKN